MSNNINSGSRSNPWTHLVRNVRLISPHKLKQLLLPVAYQQLALYNILICMGKDFSDIIFKVNDVITSLSSPIILEGLSKWIVILKQKRRFLDTVQQEL
jgi:hypothetical protein